MNAFSGETALPSTALSTRHTSAVQDDGPDAELIRMCTEFGPLLERYNATGAESSEEASNWAAYCQAADAITAAKPQTLAGMVAIARVAKLEAVCPNGEESPSGSMAETWAWNLVNDLVRLGRAEPMKIGE